jgi:radical SAM superfamily enzyme YgiQ (UPF0313 family)
MSLSISIVVPTWHYWINPIKLQPLWEFYYATYIQNNVPNSKVDILDMRGGAYTPEQLPERDVYFYWIMKSADAFEIYDTIKKLRQRFPKAVHIAGGNHIDKMTEQASSVMDAVVLGTAEGPILRSFEDLFKGNLQKVYRPTSIHPFSNYSHGSREWIPRDRVVNSEHFSQYGGVPGTGVYFSRGCSFKCSFCVYNNPGKFEYRTPEQIVGEIEYLKMNFGVKGVNLRDEVCIPVNRKLASQYLDAIGRGGIIWRGQTVPFGDEEMVKLARESGCQELALGLESADNDLVLQMANKPCQSIDTAKSYISLLKKYGIRVKVCIILGLPGESRNVVENTIRFFEEVQPDYVALSGLDPVPGSPCYINKEKFGIESISDDLSRHAHLIYRFGDEEEDVGLPFEYKEHAPWGKTFTREEIINNIKTVQGWLRDRGMSY